MCGLKCKGKMGLATHVRSAHKIKTVREHDRLNVTRVPIRTG